MDQHKYENQPTDSGESHHKSSTSHHHQRSTCEASTATYQHQRRQILSTNLQSDSPPVQATDRWQNFCTQQVDLGCGFADFLESKVPRKWLANNSETCLDGCKSSERQRRWKCSPAKWHRRSSWEVQHFWRRTRRSDDIREATLHSSRLEHSNVIQFRCWPRDTWARRRRQTELDNFSNLLVDFKHEAGRERRRNRRWVVSNWKLDLLNWTSISRSAGVKRKTKTLASSREWFVNWHWEFIPSMNAANLEF